MQFQRYSRSIFRRGWTGMSNSTFQGTWSCVGDSRVGNTSALWSFGVSGTEAIVPFGLLPGPNTLSMRLDPGQKKLSNENSCHLSLCPWLFLLCHAMTLLGQSFLDGVTYTNYHNNKIPWSIHVVQVSRSNSFFEIHTLHAHEKALGLSPLSQQVSLAKPEL